MNEEYLRAISELDEIKLVIMGKDPFPTNPNGIPFCKPTWDEQLAANSSGFVVLNSLGVDRVDQKKFTEPRELFLELANHGIVFLNVVYEYLGGNKLRMRNPQHLNWRELAFEINEPLLDQAENIVLCGEAEKNRWNGVVYPNAAEVVHPEIRNRISPVESTRQDWERNWSANSISDRFNLDLSI